MRVGKHSVSGEEGGENSRIKAQEQEIKIIFRKWLAIQFDWSKEFMRKQGCS